MNNNSINEPISWPEYFMEIAKLSAKRSKDPKTKVGACIVDPKTNHVLSVGYNGMPYGTADNDITWDDNNKHSYVIHAEANAILNATQDLKGSTLYCTMFPCVECAKLIAQKRIGRLIYDDDKFTKNKYKGNIAKEILDNADIIICKYSED